MSSQAKTYAIAAAGKVTLSGGTAFALLSAAAAVTVAVWRGSVIIANFEGVLGGLNWKSRGASGELLPFDFVEISSATAQSVIAFSGDGDIEYARSQGDVVATIAKNLSPWEGRAPLRIMRVYSAAGVAPHVSTQRFLYTVPAARQFLMQSCSLRAFRATAAAPVGLWGATLTTAVTVVSDLQTVKNAIGDDVQAVEGLPVWLGAGNSSELYTQDLSTGGTVTYFCAMSGVEFDA